eukprot:TRINITY_DN1918_c0_g2_i2.p1 TRINITY_DN1918_c0_g2~~TRINITY_DN1918_c0_g2_i2.p1  ORF type:complete len:232 (+),score=-23.17 TRINITY_DN1918_c0_g2_i2:418-1113(+)
MRGSMQCMQNRFMIYKIQQIPHIYNKQKHQFKLRYKLCKTQILLSNTNQYISQHQHYKPNNPCYPFYNSIKQRSTQKRQTSNDNPFQQAGHYKLNGTDELSKQIHTNITEVWASSYYNTQLLYSSLCYIRKKNADTNLHNKFNNEITLNKSAIHTERCTKYFTNSYILSFSNQVSVTVKLCPTKTTIKMSIDVKFQNNFHITKSDCKLTKKQLLTLRYVLTSWATHRYIIK